MIEKPRHLDIKRDRGLTIEWSDGSTSFYSVNYLRKWSPSAEARQLREDLAKNPLAVMPNASRSSAAGPLTIADAEFVGHYAVRLVFSDGHDTGLYSWDYLHDIDPALQHARVQGGSVTPTDAAPPDHNRGGASDEPS